MRNKFVVLLMLLAIMSFNISCKKYLEKIPDKKLVIPSSLDDIQNLLDNTIQLNLSFSPLPEILSDNYFISYTNWQSFQDRYKAYYTWQKYDQDNGQWATYFTGIYITNVALEYLNKISDKENIAKWNELKGSALFFRSYLYYNLAQLYAQPFDTRTSNLDLGLPLRLSPDFNESSIRSSVQQTYDQIISDLKLASALLPKNPSFKNRPSKGSAYGALARAFLVTQDYLKAGLYADSAIQINGFLMRFDTLNTTSSNPINEYTAETIFHGRANSAPPLGQSRYLVDTNLIKSYNVDDLRLDIFFKKNPNGFYTVKSDYSGYGNLGFRFAGIAANEMYLIRAESLARLGDYDLAMNDLNILLQKRWKLGAYIPIHVNDPAEALQIILRERRKELVNTLTRWSDLRRLNKESQFQITVKRVLNGIEYVLVPNSSNYTLQIPKIVIDKSRMIQNP